MELGMSSSIISSACNNKMSLRTTYPLDYTLVSINNKNFFYIFFSFPASFFHSHNIYFFNCLLYFFFSFALSIKHSSSCRHRIQARACLIRLRGI